jgi:hypothetical protein
VEITDYETLFEFCPLVPPFFTIFKEYHSEHIEESADFFLSIEDKSPEFRALLATGYEKTENSKFIWKAAQIPTDDTDDDLFMLCVIDVNEHPEESKQFIIQTLEIDTDHTFLHFIRDLEISFADLEIGNFRDETLAFILAKGATLPQETIVALTGSSSNYVRNIAVAVAIENRYEIRPPIPNEVRFRDIIRLTAEASYSSGFAEFDEFIKAIVNPTPEFMNHLWEFFVGDQIPAFLRRSKTIGKLIALFATTPKTFVDILRNFTFTSFCNIRPVVSVPIVAVLGNLQSLLLTETGLLLTYLRDFNFSANPSIFSEGRIQTVGFSDFYRVLTPASAEQFQTFVQTDSAIDPLTEIPLSKSNSVSEALTAYVLSSPIINTPAILVLFCQFQATSTFKLDDTIFVNGVRYRLNSVINTDDVAFLRIDGLPGFLKYRPSSMISVGEVDGDLFRIIYERLPFPSSSKLHRLSLGYSGNAVVSKILHNDSIDWSIFLGIPEVVNFTSQLVFTRQTFNVISSCRNNPNFSISFFTEWLERQQDSIVSAILTAGFESSILALAQVHPQPAALGISLFSAVETHLELVLKIWTVITIPIDDLLIIWDAVFEMPLVLNHPSFRGFAISVLRQLDPSERSKAFRNEDCPPVLLKWADSELLGLILSTEGEIPPLLHDFIRTADITRFPVLYTTHTALIPDSTERILHWIWNGSPSSIPNFSQLVEAVISQPILSDSQLSTLFRAPSFTSNNDRRLWVGSIFKIAAKTPHGLGFLTPENLSNVLIPAVIASNFKDTELDSFAEPLLTKVTDDSLPTSFANITVFAHFPFLIKHFPIFVSPPPWLGLLAILPTCDCSAFRDYLSRLPERDGDSSLWDANEIAQELIPWFTNASLTINLLIPVRQAILLCPEFITNAIDIFCSRKFNFENLDERLIYARFLLSVWEDLKESARLFENWMEVIIDELRSTVLIPKFTIASIVPLLTAVISVFAKKRGSWLFDFLLGKLTGAPELILIGNGTFGSIKEMQLVKQTFINIRQHGQINGERIVEFVAGIQENEREKVELFEFFLKSWPKVFSSQITEIEQSIKVSGETELRITNAIKKFITD